MTLFTRDHIRRSLIDLLLIFAVSAALVAHLYFPSPDLGSGVSRALKYISDTSGVLPAYFLLALLYAGGYVAVLFGGYTAYTNRAHLAWPFALTCALLTTMLLPAFPRWKGTYTGAEIVFPATLLFVVLLAKTGQLISSSINRFLKK